MHRNVTAIYRNHATADLVRQELEAVGIGRGYIRIIPDSDVPVAASGERDDHRHLEALHDLHLPDEDVRTYQSCVRRGDYVVSAEIDEDQVGRVQQVMRRPEDEAYNIDARAGEFGDDEFIPRPVDRQVEADWAGARDETPTDPYSRTYRRNRRLDPYE